MTDKINELMRLATALPAASCGSNANYIEAVERLRTALEAALNAAAMAESDAYLRGYNVGHEAALKPGGRDTEHAAFEEWLADACPSGDAESVQRKWDAYKERNYTAPPAQPDVKPGEPVTWAEAEAIAIRPSVEDAIEALLADQTLDNATGVVMAILKAAPTTHVQGKPVYWEWRWFDANPNTVTYGQWTEWKRVGPRNLLQTMEDAVNEFRVYIASGLRYELRALYTSAPPAQTPCKWPTCQTEEYQHKLADDVASELIGTPRREPLSDGQIQAIRAECVNTPPDKASTAYGWAINFARAIEQAHGITGKRHE